jgi:ribosome-associated translation inhibitor RaiA
MFEKLSGSEHYKEPYMALKQDIAKQESQMKKVSEKLKDLRHEKIKIKGLSDF